MQQNFETCECNKLLKLAYGHFFKKICLFVCRSNISSHNVIFEVECHTFLKRRQYFVNINQWLDMN